MGILRVKAIYHDLITLGMAKKRSSCRKKRLLNHKQGGKSNYRRLAKRKAKSSQSQKATRAAGAGYALGGKMKNKTLNSADRESSRADRKKKKEPGLVHMRRGIAVLV